MNFDSSSETSSKLDRVRDEIRLFIRQGLGADPILVRDVAVEFGEACAYINQRLHKIGRLLRTGLTSEAIQLAEENPPVLSLVAQLSFPDSEAWNALLYQLNLEQPPAILLEIARDLEKAMDEYLRLQSLLDQHRLLALARAPLASRILVLRKILRREPGNPAWTSDLKAWETQRLSQIPSELGIASQKQDLEKLIDLDAELESGWTVAVPEELVGRSRKELANEKARRSTSAMAAAAAQLADARVAGDIEGAREAHKRLQKMDAEVMNATISSPQADPEDVQWLRNQQLEADADRRFEAEVASIKRLIAFDANPEVVQERLGKLEMHLRPAPPELYERANRYFRTRARRLRNKRILRVAAAIAGIILIAASVFLISKSLKYHREVNALFRDVDEKINKEDFFGARRLLDSNPHLNDNKKVAERRGKIDENLTRIAKWEIEYTNLQAQLLKATRDKIDKLKNSAVTEEQRKRAIALENKWNLDTNREHDLIVQKAKETKQYVWQLPERAAELKAIENELGSLILESTDAGDGEIKLTPNQLMKANNLLALVQNALIASRADPVAGFAAYDSALAELVKHPSSSRMANDLLASREELAIWNQFNDSQLIAFQLPPEAFAGMTTSTLKRHFEELKGIRSSTVQIGDKQLLDKLTSKIKSLILDRQEYFREKRSEIWIALNAEFQFRPMAPGQRTRRSTERNKQPTIRPEAPRKSASFIDVLEEIMSNNDLATLEATYIQIIECLLENRTEWATLNEQGSLIKVINTKFQSESLSVRDSLGKHHVADDMLLSGENWPEVRKDILINRCEGLELIRWRELFNYKCIGWLYQVPNLGDEADMTKPFPFTLVGNRTATETEELFCLLGTGDIYSMESVGKLSNGSIQTSQNGPRLQAGRPVFIKLKQDQ